MMDDTQLTDALEQWGKAPMADEAAVARLMAHADAVSAAANATTADAPRRWWAWGTGGALAAGLALALVWTQPVPVGPSLPVASLPGGEVPLGDPELSFLMLYSPTPDEEMLL